MSSKFSGLLQAKQAQSAIVEESAAQESAAPAIDEPKIEEPAVAAVETNPEVALVTPPAPQPSLAQSTKTINMQPNRGKKGHPDYNQVTIYLKKETQNNAKIALLQARDERDFSELVEELLTGWLATQK